MKKIPDWLRSENRRGARVTSRCNGPLLKHLRESRQLTQAELAKASGFSERLIVKAEAGGNLSANTLDIIAQALSEIGSPTITFEVLTSDPLQIAKRYTECLYKGGEEFFDLINKILDKNAVFVIHGDPAVVPFAGRWEGIEQIVAGFSVFFSIMEAPPNHDVHAHYHFIAQGMDVVAWGDSYLCPKGMPLVAPMRVSNLFRFREGRIYLFEDNFDTERASKFFERQPQLTASELESIARTWFERAFNQRDPSVIDDLIDSDVVLVAEGETVHGRDAIRQRVGALLGAFNPLRIEVEKLLTHDDTVIVYWKVEKTHTGEFFGVPPTGKQVTVQGSSMAKCRDGRIIEIRDHWDIDDLFKKLGVRGV